MICLHHWGVQTMIRLRGLKMWLAAVFAATITSIIALPARSAVFVSHTNNGNVANTPTGFGTVTQKAIRLLAAAMRSGGLPRVMKFLAKHQGTGEQIRVIVKYSGATAKIPDGLSKADQASLAWVRGQVEALLVKYSGATQVDASRVGFWMEKMLDWGL